MELAQRAASKMGTISAADSSKPSMADDRQTRRPVPERVETGNTYVPDCAIVLPAAEGTEQESAIHS